MRKHSGCMLCSDQCCSEVLVLHTTHPHCVPMYYLVYTVNVYYGQSCDSHCLQWNKIIEHSHTLRCMWTHEQTTLILSSYQIKCFQWAGRRGEERRGEDYGKIDYTSLLSLHLSLIFTQGTLSELSQHLPCNKPDSASVIKTVPRCISSQPCSYKVHVYTHMKCLLIPP